MTNIRNINEIILSFLDFYRSAQPDADTKPGTVIRDVFIDAPAAQISILYDELAAASTQQSLRLVIGSDLDKLAKNFGIVRRQSTAASGVALFTFSSINAPVNIRRGDVVISTNGFSYSVVSGVAILPSALNFYKSVASKFREQLDFVGISDLYAVEISVRSTTSGSGGNVGAYSINKTNIAGVSNVTNIKQFVGGVDQEEDSAFRNRVLSTFGGSSVGTNLGYVNTTLSTSGVNDTIVIEPGNVLMTRDGTQVKTNTDGSKTITSEGSGGMVDVVVLGSNLIESIDSYIYKDKSNNNDPTSAKNDIVLGQISGDENKTVNRKRIDNIKSGNLPSQPVDSVLQVTGSLSGSNFVEKTIDQYGRISGNYEIMKDTGVYSGSPWGFDKFHWVSDRVSSLPEDKIKGQLYGQDNVVFSDVTSIPKIQQNILINNENSTVTSDRSLIQLLHTPVTNVTRVFNVNTGERYVITSQNPDNSTEFNQTGRIKISGNTLPTSTDILQVDYNWIVDYDRYSDYDGLEYTSNSRTVNDSIDWGYSSLVKQEKVLFSNAVDVNFFNGTTSHPINTVVSVDKYLQLDAKVFKITSGIYVDRLSVILTKLSTPIQSVDSVKIRNTNTEAYKTAQNNGLFINSTLIVGIDLLNQTNIIFPQDTLVKENDYVTCFTNKDNVYHSSSLDGSFNNNKITIPSTLVNSSSNIFLYATYIANVIDNFSSAITSLSTSRVGNGFSLLNNNGFNNFSITNVSRREHQIIQLNLSSQLYVELNLPAVDCYFDKSFFIKAIRLSDYKDLWDSAGTVITGNSGNYQLIFSGVNTPVIGDRVLIIYYANDIRRFQPFSFSNDSIKTRIDTLSTDPSGKQVVFLNNFTTESLSFQIVDGYANNTYFSTTGTLTALTSSATLTSVATLSTLPDLIYKKVKITSATNPNNNGVYDIIAYDSFTNVLTISNDFLNITKDQISVIRILDGQELWNYSGSLLNSSNKALLPSGVSGDKVFVMFFNQSNIRKTPTKLLSSTVDQVVNQGVLTVAGTTLYRAKDIIFTSTNIGFKINFGEALRKALNLSSTTPIPTNVKLVKLIKLEKVTTISSSNDEVLTVVSEFDTKNTKVSNNLYYSDYMVQDSSLSQIELTIPSTANNKANAIKHTDKFRISFYYIVENDSESLNYTRNGQLYTNKKFAFINKLYISSGFKSSQATKVTLTQFTQPILGSRYKAFYDYLAPKQNERIVIKSNYNKLISDVTFNIENTRPINADVLARQAKLLSLDLTMNVVISDDYKSSTTNVLQNLRDQLTAVLTTNKLNEVIDNVTLINTAQGVAGIARARILYFNKNGVAGTVLKIQAQEDEYFSPNNIILNTETR